jgi:hypothetical protein
MSAGGDSGGAEAVRGRRALAYELVKKGYRL